MGNRPSRRYALKSLAFFGGRSAFCSAFCSVPPPVKGATGRTRSIRRLHIEIRERPQWLKHNPGKWRRFEDAEQGAAPLRPDAESEGKWKLYLPGRPAAGAGRRALACRRADTIGRHAKGDCCSSSGPNCSRDHLQRATIYRRTTRCCDTGVQPRNTLALPQRK